VEQQHELLGSRDRALDDDGSGLFKSASQLPPDPRSLGALLTFQ